MRLFLISVMVSLMACGATAPARRPLLTDQLALGTDRAAVSAWYQARGWCGADEGARSIYRRCQDNGDPYEVQLGFDADDHLITAEARFNASGRPIPPTAGNNPNVKFPEAVPREFNGGRGLSHQPDQAERTLDRLAAELETRHGSPVLTTTRGRMWRLPDHEIELFIAPSRGFVVERHSRMPGSGGVTASEPARPASSR